ncbi:hypothetical protein D9756_003262 [Leucocoprinus leucothites]|uniref:Beta-glucuronidase C-terminal domain-containing protein n=1 Tax=Leucocoprinus leucothites TaxID=201217 RepID=A0A8H5G746_9AGAR|nr:hypothetical protein D9756_003262 [Leucoagaricus leucothites]
MPPLGFTSTFILLALVAQTTSVSVTVPVNAPDGAIPVAPSLIGFSLEQDRWTDWVGLNSRNQFLFNVFENLRDLSGKPPFIRIGADSEDHTDFGPGIVDPQLHFPNPSATVPYPEASTITVGDAYYEAARFLLPNTHVVWGVNFGSNNLTAANLEARAIAKAFASSAIKSQGIVLDAIEIGNEPDFYSGGHRPPGYTSTQYVKEWTTFAANISAAIGITPSSSTKFWGASFASSSHSTSGFSPQAIFNEGLLNDPTGHLISTISQHHYSGNFCSGSGALLQDLMTKASIRGNLTIFAPDANSVRSKGIDYVLGETNSIACHGAPGVSNTAGAALWALDYALFATQIGASRVFFHEGIGYKYNSIQPLTLTRSTIDATPLPKPLPPHVQPQYYATIIAAEAIGPSGNTRMVELTINDSSITGYAFYEGSRLARAVFINLHTFLTSSSSRGKAHLDLTFANGSARSATLKRLSIKHADDTAGLTWAGQTYETPDGKVRYRDYSSLLHALGSDEQCPVTIVPLPTESPRKKSTSALWTTVNVTVPVNAPDGAVPVAPSLIGFSLEQDRWTDWVGLNSRNQFFFNVLENLKDLSGKPPFIRIGANSEDHTNYNPSIVDPQLVFPDPTTTVPYPEATTIVVGDAYYEAARFLLPNTHVVWGVNFGQNNLTAANLEARAIVKAFASSAIKSQGIVLDAVEIGNEPDLYSGNGHRPSGYTSAQYVKEWTTFAANISAAIGITPSSSTKFWGASFAGSSHSTSGFSPQAIFNEGLLNDPTGHLISTISQHHYSGSFCSGSGALLQDLMTKASIRGNLTIFAPDANSVRSKGIDYVLGETNSFSCHGAPGVSNTAGAALWSLDYALFATQIEASRVFFHEGIGFKYDFIQPLTLTRSTTDATPLPKPLPPHVQPQYYAAIIAAEAIGPSGNTRMVELTINDSSISGYAFYEGSRLARAVFINLHAFLTSSSSRGKTHLDLTFANGSARSATLKRLTIKHADDTAGLTWAGQTYETPDGKVSGSAKPETVNLQNGFDIQDTEIVLVSFAL